MRVKTLLLQTLDISYLTGAASDATANIAVSGVITDVNTDGNYADVRITSGSFTGVSDSSGIYNISNLRFGSRGPGTRTDITNAIVTVTSRITPAEPIVTGSGSKTKRGSGSSRARKSYSGSTTIEARKINSS